jgi:hypothetical protein
LLRWNKLAIIHPQTVVLWGWKGAKRFYIHDCIVIHLVPFTKVRK